MEKILTLHPEGKSGVNIDRKRYNQVRNVLLLLLAQVQEMTFKELSTLAADRLSQAGFDGKPLWYIVTVKLDLEARGEVLRLSGRGPQRLALAANQSN